jgi:hypothetical protein
MTETESLLLKALEKLLNEQTECLTRQCTEPLKSLQLGVEERISRLERSVSWLERAPVRTLGQKKPNYMFNQTR